MTTKAVIYERQRKLAYFGYSGDHLLPSDKCSPFVDEHGIEQSSCILKSSPSSLYVYEPVIHPDRTDAHGWCYGAGFDEQVVESSMTADHVVVRTREWIAVPCDAIARNNPVVKRAAGKFKAMTLRRPKPLYINVVSAGAGLVAGDIVSGKSDPYVIVTAQARTDRKPRLVQRFMSKTRVIQNTLIPTWNERILVPAVDATYDLTFTVADHDLLSRDDFLGQHNVSICSFAHPLQYQNLQLPLQQSMTYQPLHQDTTPIRLSGGKSSGSQGVVRVELIPLPPSTSMAGYLQVQRQEGPQRRRYVVLTGPELYLYEEASAAVVIQMQHISSIRDEVDHFQLVDSSDGSEWRFQPDLRTGSIIRQHKERKQWLATLATATGLDIQTSEAAQKQRIASSRQIERFGHHLLERIVP